jgi:hypothetical protein
MNFIHNWVMDRGPMDEIHPQLSPNWLASNKSVSFSINFPHLLLDCRCSCLWPAIMYYHGTHTTHNMKWNEMKSSLHCFVFGLCSLVLSFALYFWWMDFCPWFLYAWFFFFCIYQDKLFQTLFFSNKTQRHRFRV